MKYGARLSVIDDRYGFMGVKDITVEVDDGEDPKAVADAYADEELATKYITYLVDEVWREE